MTSAPVRARLFRSKDDSGLVLLIILYIKFRRMSSFYRSIVLKYASGPRPF